MYLSHMAAVSIGCTPSTCRSSRRAPPPLEPTPTLSSPWCWLPSVAEKRRTRNRRKFLSTPAGPASPPGPCLGLSTQPLPSSQTRSCTESLPPREKWPSLRSWPHGLPGRGEVSGVPEQTAFSDSSSLWPPAFACPSCPLGLQPPVPSLCRPGQPRGNSAPQPHSHEAARATRPTPGKPRPPQETRSKATLLGPSQGTLPSC